MKETIKEIPLGELHPFPDHPFGVRDDEAKPLCHITYTFNRLVILLSTYAKDVDITQTSSG